MTDPHETAQLTPVRVQLYSVQVKCDCGWASEVVPSSSRHLAWGQAVRHLLDIWGPGF